MTDVIFTMDLNLRYTYVSPSVLRLRGVSAEEALAEDPETTLAPDSARAARRILAEELSRESSRRADPFRSRKLELQQMRKDGSTVWTEVTATFLRDKDNKPIGILGITRDIHDRKLADEALRISEARYRELFENANDAIATFDIKGRVTSINRAAERMLGYPKEEVDSMTFWDITTQRDHERLRKVVQLINARETPPLEEAEVIGKDGRHHIVEFRARPILECGKPTGIQVIGRDITERKQADKALALERNRLRHLSSKLLHLQDDERRRIARELHDSTAQGLAGLAMNLAVLKDSKVKLDPPFRRALAESIRLSKHCSKEVRTLSYLLHPPLLDELGLTSALRWFVHGFAERSGIKIRLDMARSLGRLPAEIELALYRIVQEGLANIQFHSGSEVGSIHLTLEAGRIRLTIADKGHGFSLGAGKTSHGGSGESGVGIGGMRERLRELGGNLKIDSNRRGTTLTADLPYKGSDAWAKSESL